MMINTMKTAMIIASDAGARTAGIIREELGKEVDLSLYRNGAGVSDRFDH